MARNPITAAERRGIVALVAVTLLVTGAGLLTRHCNRGAPSCTPPSVESAKPDRATTDSIEPDRHGKKKKGKGNKATATRGGRKRAGKGTGKKAATIPVERDIFADTVSGGTR